MASDAHRGKRSDLQRRLIALGFGAGSLGLSGAGTGTALDPAMLVLAFLASATGWGILAGLALPTRTRLVVPHAPLIGSALLMTLLLTMGLLGVMGRWPVLVVFAVGISGWLFLPERRESPRRSRWDPSRTLARLSLVLGGLTLLASALVAPPGYLWPSEFGGYDSLSYHLELPNTWLETGRIATSEQNIYSFLPGLMEASFAQLSRVSGAASLVANDGKGLFVAQALHVVITLLGAGALFHAVRRAMPGDGPGPLISSAIFVVTPWIVVTGSLAYNDAAAAAFFAGACAVALDRRISGPARGLLVGLLMGAACSCKPTAIFMSAPISGALLLYALPRRAWAGATLACLIAGTAMIAPWLIRNGVSVGNPVFPALTGVFGNGHWTDEQIARFASGHRFDGSILDRLRLAIFPDPTDPAGTRHRGLMHPQWFGFFPIVLAAAVLAIRRCATRPIATLLASGLALQLLAWAFLTHVQSRFLIPCVVPGAILVGLATRGKAGQVAGFVAIMIQSAGLVLLLASERALFVSAPLIEVYTGNGWVEREFLAASPPERMTIIDRLPASAAVNLLTPENAVVCLIGDAKPLYYMRDVIYATTWDAHPLGDAIRDAPRNPAAWVARLRDLGVTHLFVDLSEIARLSRSGWADPALSEDAVRELLESDEVGFVHVWTDRPWVLCEIQTSTGAMRR
ncbi:MAG: hypothetical protein AAGB51_08370 [Planctomycetota bacterium]